MILLFSLTARKEFELLCKKYLVTQPQARSAVQTKSKEADC